MALPGAGAPRVDANREFPKLSVIADTAVHDHPGPPILDGEQAEVAAEQGAPGRTAARHEQHPAPARLLEGGADQHVVLEHRQGRDRAGIAVPAAVGGEYGVEKGDFVAVLIAEIRGPSHRCSFLPGRGRTVRVCQTSRNGMEGRGPAVERT